MAKAIAEYTSHSGDWVSLVTIVNRAGGIDDSEPQRAWVLDELRAERLHYRYYLDEHKTFRCDDLPEHFWHLAKIHWLFSVAELEPILAQGIEVFLPCAGNTRAAAAPASAVRARGVASLVSKNKGGNPGKWNWPGLIPQLQALLRPFEKNSDFQEWCRNNVKQLDGKHPGDGPGPKAVSAAIRKHELEKFAIISGRT